jgi:D-beta-D-heptose 7-phosphate kinase/D-beta-D-heptose 1-phosphate adenosyltransferase
MERRQPKIKVWVNGTFDVLHVGHLKLLEFASSFGELRVGIDTDKRVKELKGNDRPFNTTEDRKHFLESLKFVNDVVVFDSRQELIDLVREYQPDYMIIGDDYKDQIVYGSEHAKQLVFFEKLSKYSTTKILNYENNSNR